MPRLFQKVQGSVSAPQTWKEFWKIALPDAISEAGFTRSTTCEGLLIHTLLGYFNVCEQIALLEAHKSLVMDLKVKFEECCSTQCDFDQARSVFQELLATVSRFAHKENRIALEIQKQGDIFFYGYYHRVCVRLLDEMGGLVNRSLDFRETHILAAFEGECARNRKNPQERKILAYIKKFLNMRISFITHENALALSLTNGLFIAQKDCIRGPAARADVMPTLRVLQKSLTYFHKNCCPKLDELLALSGAPRKSKECVEIVEKVCKKCIANLESAGGAMWERNSEFCNMLEGAAATEYMRSVESCIKPYALFYQEEREAIKALSSAMHEVMERELVLDTIDMNLGIC